MYLKWPTYYPLPLYIYICTCVYVDGTYYCTSLHLYSKYIRIFIIICTRLTEIYHNHSSDSIIPHNLQVFSWKTYNEYTKLKELKIWTKKIENHIFILKIRKENMMKDPYMGIYIYTHTHTYIALYCKKSDFT